VYGEGVGEHLVLGVRADDRHEKRESRDRTMDRGLRMASSILHFLGLLGSLLSAALTVAELLG
jgi:hypothetical protein